MGSMELLISERRPFLILKVPEKTRSIVFGQDRTLFLLLDEGVYRGVVDDGGFELYREGLFADIVFVKDGGLFAIMENDGALRELDIVLLNTDGSSETVSRVYGLGGQFTQVHDSYVVVQNDLSDVYLVDTRMRHRNVVELGRDARIKFIGKDDLLSHNGFEVTKVSLASDAYHTTLVTREGGGIQDVVAFSEVPYVFLLRGETTFVGLELTSGSSNRYTLYNSDDSVIRHVVADETVGGVYVTGSISGKEGIYYLPVF